MLCYLASGNLFPYHSAKSPERDVTFGSPTSSLIQTPSTRRRRPPDYIHSSMSAPNNVLSLVTFIVTNFFDVSVIILALNAMSKERENQAGAATGMKLEATQVETAVEEYLASASTSKVIEKKTKIKSIRIETVDEYVDVLCFAVGSTGVNLIPETNPSHGIATLTLKTQKNHSAFSSIIY